MIVHPYLIVIIPIIIATLAYIFPFKKTRLLILFLQSILFILSVLIYIEIRKTGEAFYTITNKAASYGVVLKYNNVTCVMLMLTTFLFLALLIYNYKKMYLGELFLFLFIVLESLIIALFLSNDLFTIYVLLEVSTIVVSVLIMYKKDSESVYDGIIYLMVNIVSMTFYLLGIGFVYKVFGTLDMSSISEKMHLIENKNEIILPFALIITSLSLKSALMPLFSWLPRAHGSKSSPSIISALLSGLYVKVALFLFIEIKVLFLPVIDASHFFVFAGIVTGIVGFILALSQKDIKLLLAYSTISQIGLIMVGLNVNYEASYYGSLYHIINHAIFKSALFLIAGIIQDKYGTRDITKIKGVFKELPYVSIAALLSILGITGAPLFNSSISKYLIQTSLNHSWIDYSIMFINLGTIMVFVRFMEMFIHKSDKPITKISLNQRYIILLLGILSFVGGIFAKNIITFLFKQTLYISPLSYLEKSLVYILSLFLGFIIYEFIKRKTKLLKKIRKIELSFNNICLSIAIFFFIILGYIRFVI